MYCTVKYVCRRIGKRASWADGVVVEMQSAYRYMQ